jgi:hypothetical protein
VSEALEAVAKAKPANPVGYFSGVCVRRLKRHIPHASDDLLKAAMRGDEAATKIVFLALTTVVSQ